MLVMALMFLLFDLGVKYSAQSDDNLFIRFKDIPPNEISGVYDGDCGKIRDEIGTSCYRCIKHGQNYNIVLSSISNGMIRDLWNFVDSFEDGKIPAYLIKANQVGIGSYGEPVVKNIKIIKKLVRVELSNTIPRFKMDITNPQLQCPN